MLYGQLVGVVASPVTGLVRTLSALLGGLAVALGQVREQKQSGEIPGGEEPAADAQQAQDIEPPAAEEPETPAAREPETPAAQEPETPAAQEPAGEERTEPADEPAQEDDEQAQASAAPQPGDAEPNPTKED
jgi:hypothetical protein